MINYKEKVLKIFFDFYVITALDTFCGEKTLNYANKARRVSETCANIVDDFYKMVLESLRYSVFREYRHFAKCTVHKRRPEKLRLSKQIKLLFANFDDEYCPNFNDKKRFTNSVMRLPTLNLNQIASDFAADDWEKDYGGKKWAKGAKMLLNLPTTHEQKILWIDKVLDLYHNSGHLLNKSVLFFLSKRRLVGPIPRKRKSALNYRRNAQTLSELAMYGTHKIRNLLTVNKTRLPEKII